MRAYQDRRQRVLADQNQNKQDATRFRADFFLGAIGQS
jgi:hypothetical protein